MPILLEYGEHVLVCCAEHEDRKLVGAFAILWKVHEARIDIVCVEILDENFDHIRIIVW